MDAILNTAKSWLTDFFDPAVKKEIQDLIANDTEELKDRFYKNMEFGTGGMRGVMGVGTNRINKYTLGKSTQGLSNYLKKVYDGEDIKVVIAFDCRNNSDTLARTVASSRSSVARHSSISGRSSSRAVTSCWSRIISLRISRTHRTCSSSSSGERCRAASRRRRAKGAGSLMASQSELAWMGP